MAVVAAEELGGTAFGAGVQMSEEAGMLPCWAGTSEKAL